MAEESLRDLVVRLSLQGDNYTRNITAIQKLTRELESEFKLAASGNKDYENTLEGLSKKAEMYKGVIENQKKIVAEYEKIVVDANKKLEEANKNRIDAETRLAAVVDKESDEYTKLANELERCRKSSMNMSNAVTDANRHLNEAKIKLNELNVASKENQSRLEAAKAGWETSTSRIAAADVAIAKLSNDIQRANYDFEAATAGMKNVGDTVDGVQKKYDMLTEKVHIASEVYRQNVNALKASEDQLAAAKVGNNKDQIAEAEANVKKYTLAVSKSKAELEKFKAEHDSVGVSLNTLRGGWEASGEAAKRYKDTVTSMNSALKNAENMFKAQSASLRASDGSMAALDVKYKSLTAKSGLLQQKMAALSEELRNVQKQLNAAEEAGDTEKIESAKKEVNELTEELTGLNAKIAETNRQADETKGQALGKIIPALKDFNWELSSSGEKLQKVGGILQSTGAKMSALSAGIVALGKSVVQSAVDFEYSFSYVRKTVQTTEEGYTRLERASKEMSTTLATSASDINRVMMTAGQLGIEAKNVEAFSKAMTKVGIAANDLSAEEASTTFAQFMNIMGGTQGTERYNALASAVVEVGNTTATTESKVSAMMLRLAGAGRQIGMTEQDIVGIAAALSSVGIEAQMGGSSFSKALINIEKATVDGGEALKQYADLAGLTTKQFKELWETDPTEAFMKFVEGLAKLDEEGESAIKVLEDIGIKEIRLRDTMLRTVGSIDKMRTAINTARDAYEDTANFETRVNALLDTTRNRVENLKNKTQLLGIEFGNSLLPLAEKLVDTFNEWVDWFSKLDESEREHIVLIAGIVSAIGPLVTIAGTVTKGIGNIKIGLENLGVELGRATIKAVATKGAMVALGVGAAAAAVAIGYGVKAFIDWQSGAKAAREQQEALNQSISDFQSGVTTAYEKSKGLSLFGLSEDDFKFDEVEKGGKSWFQKTLDVWSDGKKETNKIVNDTIKDFKDGSTEIENYLRGQTDENPAGEYATDLALLEQIDKDVEEIIRKKQNGLFTEEDIANLQKLIGDRDAIKFKYGFIEEEGAYQGITDGVKAAMARGAEGDKVFADAFAASVSGYGAAVNSLDAEFDKKYNELQNNGASEEEIKALREWYDAQKKEESRQFAENLYNLSAETGVFGAEGEFSEIGTLIKTINEDMGLATGADATDESVAKLNADAQELLKNKEGIVEYATAVATMTEAYESAGIELPEYLQTASDGLQELIGTSTTELAILPEEVQEAMNNLSKQIEKESNEVFVSLNADALENSFTEWANGDHTPIKVSADATAIDSDLAQLEGTIVKISEPTDGTTQVTVLHPSIDGLEGTLVTYKDDGTAAITDLSTIKGLGGTVTAYKEGDDKEKLTLQLTTLDMLNGTVKAYNDYGVAKTVKLSELHNLEGWVTAYDERGREVTEFAPKTLAALYGHVVGVKDDMTPAQKLFIQRHFPALAEMLAYVKTINIAPDAVVPEVEINGKIVNIEPPENYSVAKGTKDLEYGYNTSVKESDKRSSILSQFAQIDLWKILAANYSPDSFLSGKKSIFRKYNTQQAVGTVNLKGGIDKDNLVQYITTAYDLLQQGAEFTPEEMERLQYAIDAVKLLQEYSEANNDPNYDMSSLFPESWNLSEELPLDEALDAYKTFAEESGTIVREKAKVLGNATDEGVKEGIEEKSDEVRNAMSHLTDDDMIGEAKSNLRSNSPSMVFYDIGQNVVQGMINGINDRTGDLRNAMRIAARAAVLEAKKELVIESPSHVFRDEVGAMMMKGIGVGVVKETANQRRIIANAARNLTASAKGGVSGYGVSNTTNNYDTKQSVEITGNTFQIRDDHDINALANEIAALMKKNKRAIGAWG